MEKFTEIALKAFSDVDHRELFGVEFPESPESWTSKHRRVLQKFVDAKPDSLDQAKEQLIATLKWRKDFKPLKAAFEEEHNPKFEPFGLILRNPDTGMIITWNLYGAIENSSDIFKDMDAFVRWRIGLMERGIARMNLDSDELSQMDQVHDYLNVSFLRMSSETRSAARKVTELFQSYYPEFLRAKYFCNIPLFMTWVFKLVRYWQDERTAAKFHVLYDGKELADELGTWVPEAYGGKGKPLADQAVSR